MAFNSVTFAVFAALFIPSYWAVPTRFRNELLLFGSYVFYGWWDWRFLALLACSTVVDFSIGREMYRARTTRGQKQLLWTSVGVNLGILGVFKYCNFFVDSLVDSAGALGVTLNQPTLNILLPVGISFYTFQTISYSFDIFRGRLAPTNSLVDFATYVAFFPQLVAGPIERAHNLLPQITDRTKRTFPRGTRLNEAVRLVVGGLVKKVVLADGAAVVANQVFATYETASWLYVVIGVLAFGIQIYCDFSGYTDIARGIALLLGIDLMVNFREPYLSRNITEFWRRWHISLSDWLRDYLYVPLGGNRGGSLVTYRNLMLTMLLGGLWHGASWNFVIWGGLHGAMLAIHRAVRSGSVSATDPGVRDSPRIIATFILVSMTWVFFRAETLADATGMLRAIATLQPGELPLGNMMLVIVLAALVLVGDLWQRSLARTQAAGTFAGYGPIRSGQLVGLAVVAVLAFSGGSPEPFIYFRF
ncbi:UNVERIFIED_CONTAM: hypothetical protein GTU68_042945 [Idotea baltica]|nr:hypothetical protein [Idotea baltica]